MDLYEALKAGTSEEELLRAFHKDLDQANARIAAEEEAAANEEYLTDCRDQLVEALVEYVEALLGEDLNESLPVDYVIKSLKEFEKEIKNIITFDKKDKKTTSIKITTSPSDNDIIANFIKSLK